MALDPDFRQDDEEQGAGFFQFSREGGSPGSQAMTVVAPGPLPSRGNSYGRTTMVCRLDAAYGIRMMTAADLDALTALDRAALDRAVTPGPWYVRAMDDENATCATAVATKPNTSGDNDDLSGSTYHGVVAATSIQHHDYVVLADGRSSESAALIAAVRTALPELLRLARIGAAADRA